MKTESRRAHAVGHCLIRNAVGVVTEEKRPSRLGRTASRGAFEANSRDFESPLGRQVKAKKNFFLYC